MDRRTFLVAGVTGGAATTPTRRQPTPAEIFRLLGHTTMSGEDPLKLWARLRETRTWLAGPLAPDAWCGQVFIADHADIFAFRFLPVPPSWLSERKKSHAEHCASNFERWLGVGRWGGAWRDWWRAVGPKAPDDSYARLVWQMPDGGVEATYEWARTELNQIAGRIRLSAASDFALQAYVPWSTEPPKFAVLYSLDEKRRFLRGRSWVPGTRDGMRWTMALSVEPSETAGEGTIRWNGFYPEIREVHFCARQGQSYDALEQTTSEWLERGRIDEMLERNRTRYLKARPVSTGWVADTTAAINDQLQWTEVYTPRRRRTYITVSRGWGFFPNNSAPDFLWDSFFNALLVAQEDERKAADMMRDMVAWQNDQGMFAQFGEFSHMPFPTTPPVAWGHTQFPVGALCAAKLYMRRGNLSLLSELYPPLVANHRWWFKNRGDGQPWRDGNRNGLLELGSNYPNEIPVESRRQMASNESYDDSPQWAAVAYNEKTGTLEQDTVERNCLYAMDCWVLAWIARRLGHLEDAAALESEHRTVANRINSLLWDRARGTYLNRRWAPEKGDWFFRHISPDVFFSLLGRVAEPHQAAALRKLFHDPTKFAGEWILPTISRDDPDYPKQDYWKGKAWPPVNWLVYQGLKIAEWDREARMLAESSARMFLGPWREKGECHENFLSTTGEATGDPHYTWGALMALAAVEELIDANPWHGLRFGSVDVSQSGAVRRYPVGGALYDVSLSPEALSVERSGRALFATDRPVEIRHVRFRQGTVEFEVRSAGRVTLRTGNAASERLPAGISRRRVPL